MQSGLIRKPTDHRDYDFHKSFGTIAYDTGNLPDSYNADAGLTMPDQDAEGYPYGCTGYTQADLCTDEDRVIYYGPELYLSTPPGGLGGRDIRSSLKILTSRGPRTIDGTQGARRTAFYNIRATGILDWFDAIRVALWVTQDEHRSASIGIPWFWGTNIPIDGVLPAPPVVSWEKGSPHNAKVAGWKTVNGSPYLAIKWWGGTRGDQGWTYLDRATCNQIFSLPGADAFTVTKASWATQPVDLSVIETLVSYIHLLLQRLGLK